MKNQDFTTTILVVATAQQVFDAVNNVRNWWGDNIEGDTGKLNSTFIYRDKYLTAKIKITELSLQKIVWEVLETNNEFLENKTEWDGTKIVFAITGNEKETRLEFTHIGLTPSFECFNVCSNSWDYFITDSLKSLILTGKGKEIQGDDLSFSTSFVVDQSPAVVFDAINNVRGWWSENMEGATDTPDAEFTYHYQDVHIAKMKITTLIPHKKVVWFVKDNYFNFTKNKAEWTGTKIVFDIVKQDDDKTRVIFTHHGLVQEYECFNVCEGAWTHYIQESLKNLITTGKGNATPKEVPAEEETHDRSVAKSIYHRLLIAVPVEKVYQALTTQDGLAGWWTPKTTGQFAVGDHIRFTFEPDYFKEMKIEKLQPYSKVTWRCLKGYEDWIGTTLHFELEPHAKGTVLLFHHDGWADYTPGFASCSYDWALFFRSLKFLCETGKGFPYPEFNK